MTWGNKTLGSCATVCAVGLVRMIDEGMIDRWVDSWFQWKS